MAKNGLHIIIVGCGKVGRSLAAQLCKEGHDITLIDRDQAALQDMENLYDVMGVCGNGASYGTLQEAGVDGTDLLIAVTGSDELNLLCCTVAKRAAACDTIARVRDPDYSVESAYLREKLGLAIIVNPEMETAWEISHLLTLPVALDVNTFARGMAELVRIKIEPGNALAGRRLSDFGNKVSGSVLICAVERAGDVYIPSGSFQIQEGDIVSFVTARRTVNRFFHTIGLKTGQIKAAMIIGGGRSGYYLGRRLLDMGVEVKIIERRRERCEMLASLLHDAVIIHGDGSSADLLREEGLEYTEAVIPLTGIDEQNIFLTLYARQKNPTAKTITRVSRTQFRDVLSGMDLGSVVDPKTMTIDEIVAYVRAKNNSRGASNIDSLYHLYGDKAEAMEFNVEQPSEVTGKRLMDLKLKDNLLVACISRGGKILIPGGQDEIRPGDRVMVVTKHSGMRELREIQAKK